MWPHRIAFRNLIPRIVTIGIALVLVWSGVEHLKNPFAFLTSILRYRIIQGQIATFVAAVLPVFQTVLAAMMILGISRRATSLAAALLLTAFSLVQMSALLRGLDIGCGCFGASNNAPITVWSVARVSMLAAVVWLAYWIDSPLEAKSSDATGSTPMPRTLQSTTQSLPL
jgi:putative oxidoreductase